MPAMNRIKKPVKRRRLSDPCITTPSPAPFPIFQDIRQKPLKPLICSSCNRAISPKPGHAIVCARCNMLTCTICTRTCTAFAPSQPPTPALTHSPTPPVTPVPSPRRQALSLHSVNTHTTSKRKKSGDDDDDDESGELNHRYRALGHDPNVLAGYDLEGNIETSFTQTHVRNSADCSGDGCGRTLCRNCCFENIQSGTTTCYDCYGISL